MKIVEIRDRTETELLEIYEQKTKRLFDIRFEAASSQIQNPHESKEIKRDIARILTVLRERGVATEQLSSEKKK